MDKRRKRMFAIMLVCFSIGAAVAGQLLLKNGMNEIGRIEDIQSLVNLETIKKMATNIFVVAGVLLYAVTVLSWLGVLSMLDVSVAYPLLSISYILVAILALFLFKESVTCVRFAGVFLIVLGCFLITRSV